jgi:hypothetical protein
MESPPPLPPEPSPPTLAAAPAPAPAPLPAPAASPETERLLKAQLGGGGWFFWIAGLSLINSIAIATGANFSFVVGLGLTAMVDGIFHSPDLHLPVLAYIFDAFVLGFFVLLGFFARKGKLWAFITGFVLYALDALIYALLPESPEWLPIGFHAFVLFSIWGGMQATRKLRRVAAPAVLI